MKKPLAGVLALTMMVTGCAHDRIKSANAGEGEVVEAEGTAPYRADDLPGTKAAALAAAQRSAVELVVGVYVTAKTRVDKAVAIEQNILTKTGGYIKRYEILSEGRSGDWYKTRIRALVSTQSIHDDLDTLGLLHQPEVGNPRVAIILHEFVGENESTQGSASQALTQLLLDKGFKVVDLPSSVNPQDDAVDVAKGLSRNTAEILISGLARAQNLGYGKDFGGMSSYRASITFRVIEIGSGEVIQTVSETASGLEATPEIAAEKSLAQAATACGPDLLGLPQLLAKRAHVDLTITGLTSFEALSSFEKGLEKAGGVKDLFLRSFTQSNGVAVLDVSIDQIGPQELADESVKIGGSTWSIFQVTGRSVQLSASLAGR